MLMIWQGLCPCSLSSGVAGDRIGPLLLVILVCFSFMLVLLSHLYCSLPWGVRAQLSQQKNEVATFFFKKINVSIEQHKCLLQQPSSLIQVSRANCCNRNLQQKLFQMDVTICASEVSLCMCLLCWIWLPAPLSDIWRKQIVDSSARFGYSTKPDGLNLTGLCTELLTLFDRNG